MLIAWGHRRAVEGLVRFHGLDLAIEAYLAGSTVEEARGLTTPPIHLQGFYEVLKERGIPPRGAVSRREVLLDGFLVCKKCGENKELSEFSKHPNTQNGYDNSSCKACKKSAV